MRVLTWGKVTPGLLVSVMAGCGGGGHGGGYGSMTLAPTVSISQPAAATTINFGQALTVAWTSAYTTSCTASTSSAAGGMFTGPQMTSGSQTVVPTAAGNYTYMLSCTGSGGTQSASTSVTVTTNLLNALAPTGAIPTVGSTIDPTNGDQNPYGLVVAPASAGLITKGDLVVCNFNNATITTTTPPSGNVQGMGTTIIGLHPGTGSKPYHIAQSADLQGCNALTMLPDDSISAAAWMANANALVTAAGVVNTPFSADTFAQPWGEAFVPAKGSNPAALYVSNADGSIDRLALSGDAQSAFARIATGFCGSGSPGAVFAPSGRTYDASIDTLYIVDTSSNSIVAFANVSNIAAAGVVVSGQCSPTPPTPAPTFGGPSAASARVIATGGLLFAPLSAALLSNG